MDQTNTSLGIELSKEDFNAIVEVFYFLKKFRDKLNTQQNTLEPNETESLPEDKL